MKLTHLNGVANAFKVRNEIQTYFAKQYPIGTLEKLEHVQRRAMGMIRELEIQPSKECNGWEKAARMKEHL